MLMAFALVPKSKLSSRPSAKPPQIKSTAGAKGKYTWVSARQASKSSRLCHQGHSSSMRLMSVIALIASIVFGLISTLHSEASQSENGPYITTAFLIAAFAPKALQKFAEVKFP